MRVLSVVTLAAFLACSVSADPQPSLKRKGPPFLKKGPGGPGPMPPPQFMERFSNMSPEERKEALQKLPPERREMMERRLDQWLHMPPAERKRLEGSYAKFQELSPERQQEVRQLFKKFSDTFPPERRPEAQQAIRRLRRAETPEERQKILNNKRYQADFTEDERKVIEQMATDLPDRD